MYQVTYRVRSEMSELNVLVATKCTPAARLLVATKCTPAGGHQVHACWGPPSARLLVAPHISVGYDTPIVDCGRLYEPRTVLVRSDALLVVLPHTPTYPLSKLCCRTHSKVRPRGNLLPAADSDLRFDVLGLLFPLLAQCSKKTLAAGALLLGLSLNILIHRAYSVAQILHDNETAL